MIARVLLTATGAFALVACGAPADDDAAPDVGESSAAVEPGATPAPPAGAGAATSEPPGGAADAATEIPQALRGRWGMVPADCTSTRGDAKGLITITADQVRFYESVATLELETARSDTMIRGQFEFTGEGMTWTRDQTLSVSGDTLTRIERGGEEPGGPFTYTKCA